MIKKAIVTTTLLNHRVVNEGEHIENKIRRLLEDKEPIGETSPLIYTERKNGVMPEYDIRTDRWEIALDAMERVNREKIAKREAPGKVDKPEENKNATGKEGEKPAEGTTQKEN